MPRTSNAELPSASELWEILAKESQRLAVYYDYLKLHQDIFIPFKQLCRKYGAECDWLSVYEQIDLVELDARLLACFDKLEASMFNKTDPLYAAVYDKLVINKEPENADAIFVFGSPNDLRIRKAIELYKAGFSDKIVISGHGPFYASHTQNEAERMAKVALDEGVPESALLLEPKAITIPDNVKRTLDLFEDIDFKPAKLIIVASPFALRRCEMDWYKFTPWAIKTVPVASDSMSYDFTREGWTTTSRGIRVILNEYAKLIFETKMDLLRRERST
ncbi:MAG TPA: YdcF family protein [Candidatus Saccharimonadales bacterium]|nr:YdcF family protein [Candidatus Saccharimonadales bacterium]